jgi:hypothetical protein
MLVAEASSLLSFRIGWQAAEKVFSSLLGRFV